MTEGQFWAWWEQGGAREFVLCHSGEIRHREREYCPLAGAALAAGDDERGHANWYREYPSIPVHADWPDSIAMAADGHSGGELRARLLAALPAEVHQ